MHIHVGPFLNWILFRNAAGGVDAVIVAYATDRHFGISLLTSYVNGDTRAVC